MKPRLTQGRFRLICKHRKLKSSKLQRFLALTGNACERGRGEIVCPFGTEEGDRQRRVITRQHELHNCLPIERLETREKERKERGGEEQGLNEIIRTMKLIVC